MAACSTHIISNINPNTNAVIPIAAHNFLFLSKFSARVMFVR